MYVPNFCVQIAYLVFLKTKRAKYFYLDPGKCSRKGNRKIMIKEIKQRDKGAEVRSSESVGERLQIGKEIGRDSESLDERQRILGVDRKRIAEVLSSVDDNQRRLEVMRGRNTEAQTKPNSHLKKAAFAYDY